MSDRNRYQLVTEMPEVRPLSMGKDDLRQLADMLRARLGRHYEHPTELLDQAVLAHFRTDSPSWQSLFDWTRERVLESVPKHLHNKIDQEEVRKIVLAEMHAQGTLFDAMTKHTDGQVMLCCLARWAQSAFASVTMPHTYAAGLIATNLTREVAEQVRMPFSGMVIEIPDGLLSIDRENGEPLPLRRVAVTRMENKLIHGLGWAYIATTDSPMSFWRFGVTTPAMLGLEEWHQHEYADPTKNPFAQSITDRDQRVSICLGRLILNTCLAMADPNNVKKIGPGHKVHAEAHRRRVPGPPVVCTYVVGRPLKHDTREAVRVFVEEGREYRHLNVQTLVSGHWKPKLSARVGYPVWVEPYWRGPEDAPIVQRPHVLLGKEDRS